MANRKEGKGATAIPLGIMVIVNLGRLVQKGIINTPGKFILVLFIVGIIWLLYLGVEKAAGTLGIIGAVLIGGSFIFTDCLLLLVIVLLAGIALIVAGIKKEKVLCK